MQIIDGSVISQYANLWNYYEDLLTFNPGRFNCEDAVQGHGWCFYEIWEIVCMLGCMQERISWWLQTHSWSWWLLHQGLSQGIAFSYCWHWSKQCNLSNCLCYCRVPALWNLVLIFWVSQGRFGNSPHQSDHMHIWSTKRADRGCEDSIWWSLVLILRMSFVQQLQNPTQGPAPKTLALKCCSCHNNA